MTFFIGALVGASVGGFLWGAYMELRRRHWWLNPHRKCEFVRHWFDNTATFCDRPATVNAMLPSKYLPGDRDVPLCAEHAHLLSLEQQAANAR